MLGNDDINLQQLPILTKTTLMAEFDQIVTDRRLRLADAEQHLAGDRAGAPLFGEYRVVASGGTTGVRGVVVYDQPAWEVAVASILRLLKVQGISAGHPRGWHRVPHAAAHDEPPVRRAPRRTRRCSAAVGNHAGSRTGRGPERL